MKSSVRMTKFETAANDFVIVTRSYWRAVQDLTSLKILSRRNPLSTVMKPADSSLSDVAMMPRSTRLTKTMTASNMLKPSDKYTFGPRPMIFSINSRVKMIVKVRFAFFCACVSQSA